MTVLFSEVIIASVNVPEKVYTRLLSGGEKLIANFKLKWERPVAYVPKMLNVFEN